MLLLHIVDLIRNFFCFISNGISIFAFFFNLICLSIYNFIIVFCVLQILIYKVNLLIMTYLRAIAMDIILLWSLSKLDTWGSVMGHSWLIVMASFRGQHQFLSSLAVSHSLLLFKIAILIFIVCLLDQLYERDVILSFLFLHQMCTA